jgi:hypothetical protein
MHESMYNALAHVIKRSRYPYGYSPSFGSQLLVRLGTLAFALFEPLIQFQDAYYHTWQSDKGCQKSRPQVHVHTCPLHSIIENRSILMYLESAPTSDKDRWQFSYAVNLYKRSVLSTGRGEITSRVAEQTLLIMAS